MEKKYWIGRERSARAMARGAVTSEARLIHYELAGRYSVRAAQCPPIAQPKAEAARAMLHLPDPAQVRSVRASWAADDGAGPRGDPRRRPDERR